MDLRQQISDCNDIILKESITGPSVSALFSHPKTAFIHTASVVYVWNNQVIFVIPVMIIVTFCMAA